MTDFSDCLEQLEQIAPTALAEEWDNVGLLVGRSNDQVSIVMTCLTLTPDVAAEAIEKQVDLIVSHHPIMFRPRQEITFQSIEGSLLIRTADALYRIDQ